MAAVVGTLAAFLAGCGLPAVPPVVTKNSDRGQDSSVWHADCQAVVRRHPGVASANSVISDASSPFEKADSPKAADLDQVALGLKPPKQSEPHKDKEKRAVSFDFRSNVYEVTPYSEVYGIHPRDFVFGRQGVLLLADLDAEGGPDASGDLAVAPGGQKRSPRRGRVARRHQSGGLAWTRLFWVLAIASFLMMRMFGLAECLALLDEAFQVSVQFCATPASMLAA